MDDLRSDNEMLIRTLSQFEMINRLLAGRDRLLREIILKDARRKNLTDITIMDLGAGGGDWTAHCVDMCNKNGISVRATCVDYDPRVTSFLSKRFMNNGQVEIIRSDALDRSLWEKKNDYLFANHLLHHLPDASIVELMKLSLKTVRQRFFFVDVRRSAVNYTLFWVFASIFTGSFIRNDGLESIKRAFTQQELKKFIESAGLTEKVNIFRSGFGHLCISSRGNQNSTVNTA
jgi:2-polyprenyl-3-methyl-5-hydroxy-6-metoxy-1,4-benzoquinol methylase